MLRLATNILFGAFVAWLLFITMIAFAYDSELNESLNSFLSFAGIIGITVWAIYSLYHWALVRHPKTPEEIQKDEAVKKYLANNPKQIQKYEPVMSLDFDKTIGNTMRNAAIVLILITLPYFFILVVAIGQAEYWNVIAWAPFYFGVVTATTFYSIKVITAARRAQAGTMTISEYIKFNNGLKRILEATIYMVGLAGLLLATVARSTIALIFATL